MYRYALLTVAVIVICGLLVVGLGARQLFTAKSIGSALGPAMKVPGAIVQMMITREPFVPSLHHDPRNDRFRLDLLIVPLSDPSKREMLNLARQQYYRDSKPEVKVYGADGDVLWVNAIGVKAINLKTKRITPQGELERVNPELAMFLPTARFDFEKHLVAISPDWRQAYSFAPDTLRATQCAVPRRTSGMSMGFDNKPDAFLCTGGMWGPTNWFAARSALDLQNNFAPGYSLPSVFPVNGKDEGRQLFSGTSENSAPRARIETMERVSEQSYREAVFVEDETDVTLLRLSEPDSVVMLHRVGTALSAPYDMVRLTPNGKEVWRANTGIGTLNQVLPGSDYVVLIGDRPPIPDKVSEPIMVIFNTITGATNTVSLWRK